MTTQTTQIEDLLATENLHDSLSLSSATSLYQNFQNLFLIECPADDPTILQNIQLNAGFLEYLSTQGSPRIRELLRVWHLQSMRAENEKNETEEEVEKGMEDGVDRHVVGRGRDCSEEEILEKIVKQIRDGVDVLCVYFEGQEVHAILKLEEIKRDVVKTLNQEKTWVRPQFICQPMEAF